MSLCFFKQTAPTWIYPYGHTLSLQDALPVAGASPRSSASGQAAVTTSRWPVRATRMVGRAPHSGSGGGAMDAPGDGHPSSARDNRKTRSEEHTSELQSLMRISYAVFCLKKKKQQQNTSTSTMHNLENT